MINKIAFIIGQSGSGKTTLVDYFEKNQVEGWIFFDFDKGAIPKPEKDDIETLAPWVKAQREYWLKEVRNEKYKNQNVCLMGVGLFPWKVGEPDDISFAYLTCNQEARKKRLINRGDPHLFEAYQKDITEIEKRLDDARAKKFDNSNCTVEQNADDVKNWLLSL